MHLARRVRRVYNILRKNKHKPPRKTAERSLTMYYLFVSPITSSAEMPRILAEDTGAAELREPVFCAKTEFRLPKKGWLFRKKSTSAKCACTRTSKCTASC